MERGVASHGAARIAWQTEGEGPAVLLLPSLGRGAEDFDAVAPLVAAAGFRVVRAEPRGIGASTGPMEGLTLYDLAEDAAAALAAADIGGRAVVAGHAFGNWVARAMAVVRAPMVRGVALLAASIDTVLDPAVRASIDGSFDPQLGEAERLAHLRRGYFAPGHDARVWLSGWHAPVARMQRAATAATDAAWKRVAERVPVLYVAAAEDTIAPVPTEARLREALGPRVEMVVVERAGHALLPEQPEAVARALVDFARRIEG
ncbi:alpha/beta hydrolase [Belnapia sp. T18]|uniref:Alpha/beta hydrolase n=1 Tax=Belnapia arida TaxID=2804533 RepID=A0ABS1UAI9_9PROT|nr:alpha/beta hydrolase [Belnapia arida]MBL6080291.1 alpha/beta hydrolase [Belnapia arida]